MTTKIKMKNYPFRRTLTLAIRAKRFGYAVFEGTETLLDWGVKSHKTARQLSFARHLENLQRQFTPAVMLARTAEWVSEVALPVTLIEEFALRTFFLEANRTNKHEVSEAVARRYPDLAWQLPPKRKPWKTEPGRQLIFDAASLAVFYFAQCDTTTPNISWTTD